MTVQEQAVELFAELRRKPGLFEAATLLGMLADELFRACGFCGELSVLSDLLTLNDEEARFACELIPQLQADDIEPDLGLHLAAEHPEQPSAS